MSSDSSSDFEEESRDAIISEDESDEFVLSPQSHKENSFVINDSFEESVEDKSNSSFAVYRKKKPTIINTDSSDSEDEPLVSTMQNKRFQDRTRDQPKDKNKSTDFKNIQGKIMKKTDRESSKEIYSDSGDDLEDGIISNSSEEESNLQSKNHHKVHKVAVTPMKSENGLKSANDIRKSLAADETFQPVFKTHRKVNVIQSDSEEDFESATEILSESTDEDFSSQKKIFSSTMRQSLAKQMKTTSDSEIIDIASSDSDQKVSPLKPAKKQITLDTLVKGMKHSSITEKTSVTKESEPTSMLINQGEDEIKTPVNKSPYDETTPKYFNNTPIDVEKFSKSFESTSILVDNTPTNIDVRRVIPPTVFKSNGRGKENNGQEVLTIPPKEMTKTCTHQQYKEQCIKVRDVEQTLERVKNVLRTCKLEALPDNGAQLKESIKKHTQQLEHEKKILSDMQVLPDSVLDKKPISKVTNWDNIEAGLSAVQPKTTGKQALKTYETQKALTLECLEHLHGSLKNCPSEEQITEIPKGLKIDLMLHQQRALTWLLYRENQKPSGGILADDMGLGKTLTMITLILKSKELEKSNSFEDSDDETNVNRKMHKYPGGTLVVCPASLINQWSGEIDKRLRRGLLSYDIYHGPKRESKPKLLAEYDVVITTYSIANNEFDKKGAIFRIKWRRIILDEAHQIRNHKSQTSRAICNLSAKTRWALTGTPVHNKELDMYSLLSFLRCSPFDDLTVWRKWVTDKSAGGQERLHAVISSLMLRRTKEELQENGLLQSLPDRKWELIKVNLDKEEMDIYHRVLIFSRTLFSQFIHQKAEKNQDYANLKLAGRNNDAPNSEYFAMRSKFLKLNKVKEIQQHDILVLLLRLRQICCHPYLITKMLQGDEDLGEEVPHGKDHIDLLEQLQNLNLNDDSSDSPQDFSTSQNQNIALTEASKTLLNPSNPVFSKERKSSKIKKALELLKYIINEVNDKVVIVSQWSSYLNIVGQHLKSEGIRFKQLDGSVPAAKRMDIVDTFNDPHSKTRVLLLSLTAGGVGLNLVGGNHLFLLDLHWNPQLENQAQDRIYRMGQNKPVFVYKFMTAETIEERIKNLQEMKLEVANALLTGSKQVGASKLSLQDLKMLFEIR